MSECERFRQLIRTPLINNTTLYTKLKSFVTKKKYTPLAGIGASIVPKNVSKELDEMMHLSSHIYEFPIPKFKIAAFTA